MHNEILNNNQIKLLPALMEFSVDFYLAGGTAIALQLGHRRSIDFDLFTNKPLNHNDIRKNLNKKHTEIEQIIHTSSTEFTIIANQVKLTFLEYPFTVKPVIPVAGTLRSPDILTLSSLKAYALGRRSKWKDYVDLFFILQQHSLLEVVKATNLQ